MAVPLLLAAWSGAVALQGGVALSPSWVLGALRAWHLGSGASSPRAPRGVGATPRLLQSTSGRVSSDLPWALSCQPCLGRPLLGSVGPGGGCWGALDPRLTAQSPWAPGWNTPVTPATLQFWAGLLAAQAAPVSLCPSSRGPTSAMDTFSSRSQDPGDNGNMLMFCCHSILQRNKTLVGALR